MSKAAPWLLKARREFQEKNIWRQLVKGDVVYPLEPPVSLHREIRQASRWPEDWAPDYNSSYTEPCWIVCFIPRYSIKVQIREQDLEEKE